MVNEGTSGDDFYCRQNGSRSGGVGALTLSFFKPKSLKVWE